MVKLDKESSRPLYVQLGDILRAKINSGEWSVNEMIPSENKLAQYHGISRVTARAVVNELVSEGLLYRVQGKGTFVAQRKMEMLGPAWGGVSRQLEALGKTIRTRLVEFSVIQPSVALAETLGISLGTPVRYICRVRYADNEPISIHKTYIPLSYCPTLTEEHLEQEPLCNIIQRQFGLHSNAIHEALELTYATEVEAELLDLKKGAPIILIEGQGVDASGQIYQVAKVLFVGERVKLHFEYELDGTATDISTSKIPLTSS